MIPLKYIAVMEAASLIMNAIKATRHRTDHARCQSDQLASTIWSMRVSLKNGRRPARLAFWPCTCWIIASDSSRRSSASASARLVFSAGTSGSLATLARGFLAAAGLAVAGSFLAVFFPPCVVICKNHLI